MYQSLAVSPVIMISMPADTFTLGTVNLNVTLLKENGIKIHHLGVSCKLTVTEQTGGKSKLSVRVYSFFFQCLAKYLLS